MRRPRKLKGGLPVLDRLPDFRRNTHNHIHREEQTYLQPLPETTTQPCRVLPIKHKKK